MRIRSDFDGESAPNLAKNFNAKILAKQCGYNFKKDSLGIVEILERSVERFYTYLDSAIKTLPQPLEVEKSALFKCEVAQKYGINDRANLCANLAEIKRYNADFNAEFYNDKSLEAQTSLDSLNKNAINEWQKLLESKIIAWQNTKVCEIQSAFVERTKEWIELMKRFDKRLMAFGKGGKLFSDFIMQSLKSAMDSGESVDECTDLCLDSQKDSHNFSLDSHTNFMPKCADKSKGNLAKMSHNLAKWLSVLESDSIKKLCDMLGKLYHAENEMQMARLGEQTSFASAVATPYAKEEICGVTLGRDLENVLPEELALIDDKDFHILFDLKFAENRLFCFEKQSYESEGEVKKAQEKGVMILCVDTSGSMSGMPECVAKAIALFIAQRAVEFGRKCFLINFSIGIEMLDLSPPNGLFELMRFLQMSFCGGTDALPALKAGIKKMRDDGYKNADLLMISDFVFSDYDFADLAQEKGDENKCYTLYIGDFAPKMRESKLFSKEFYYNDDTHGVVEFCDEFL